MAGDKQHWGTRMGVILAVAGSAVGLGNFLRFPGNAATHGGGAFMIPYFIALLLLGIPIGWAEWTMGRYGGRKGFHSAPAIMGVFGKGRIPRFLGVLGVLIPLCVYFYYVLIESWCALYAWKYLTAGGIGIDPTWDTPRQVAWSSSHFNAISGVESNGALFNYGFSDAAAAFALVFALNIFLIYRGISGGIELLCNLAMPTMAVCGVLALIRVLTLGTPDPMLPDQNVMNGLGYMWNPNWEALKDSETWVAAAGQIFFSLSVGFGVIVNYASYMRKEDDVVLSGLTAAATNEFFEVALGGMITITAAVVFLGVAGASSAAGSTFNLGFNTLPVVFAHMPGGTVFGFLWFFMLCLAAITSSLSMLQPAKAFLEEALGVDENVSTPLIVALCAGGNLFVMYFSKGLVALDTIDFWVGSVMIFMLATIQIILFGWVFGLEQGVEEAHTGAHMHIPGPYRFIIKYVSPTYLLVVFGYFAYDKVPGYLTTLFEGIGEDAGVARLTWGLIGLLILGLGTVTWIGERRWRAAGLDVDGRLPPTDIAT